MASPRHRSHTRTIRTQMGKPTQMQADMGGHEHYGEAPLFSSRARRLCQSKLMALQVTYSPEYASYCNATYNHLRNQVISFPRKQFGW